MTIKVNITLKKLLHENDLTAAELSRACKIAPQTINNWLSGLEPRSFSQVKVVADFFGVSVDYLVFGLEKKSKRRESDIEDFAEEINAGTFEVVLRRVKL